MHRARFLAGSLLAVLAVSSVLAGSPGPGASERETALQPGKVPVDEFNDAVKDKVRGEGTPVRGGTIRVRLPTDPTNLNDVTTSDATATGILKYVNESLISYDLENFERIPGLAWNWEIRDLIELKEGGKILDGRILEETAETVKFAPGAGAFRVGRVDVKSFDAAAGKMELKDGRKLEGAIKEHEYTIEIERRPGETAVYKRADLKSVRPNCWFLFEARDGVLWHDGVPFSVDDVTFTLETIRNEFVDCAPLRNYYRDIETCERVGEKKVKFTYRQPYYRALTFCGGMTIMPKHRYAADKYKNDPKGFGDHFNKHPDNLHPIGLGPFKFEKWEKGRSISIVRNDKYWAQTENLPYWKPEQPYLDRIEWVIINNKVASLKELQNGRIDADFDIEQDTWEKDETSTPGFKAKFVRAKHLTPMVTYIGWNSERPFFKDRSVRNAMTMLVDRKRILKEIHNDLGLEITGPNYIYGPAYDHELKPLPYDVKAAKKLLRQAGWVDHDGDGIIDKDGVAFEFTYLIHNARDYHQKIADIVKESIEQAGIKVNIKKIDWQVFADHVRDHQFDAVRFAVSEPMPIEPDPYQYWHSSMAKNRGDNFVSFIHPRVDEIIEEARRTFDDEKRWKLYREFHRILHDEQPWTFLYCFYELYFYSNKLRGVKLYKMGTNPWNFAEWYIPAE